ncbi:MAG: glycoside hydrolase family 3 protein [Acidobacteria bacterium]|nr:glycoside hydrolase family 3 protein [Acidobacteriota bacterium]
MQTLTEQLGQVLLIGFEGDGWSRELDELLREVRPAGVIFFERNIAGAEPFQLLVVAIRGLLETPAATPPLLAPLLAIDQEGGMVDRLRKVLAPLPSASDAARAGLGFELGQMAGRELAAFALNVDFAPVLDLSTPQSADILASRAAGETPQQVITFAEQFLAGLRGQGIVGCGKHFPGLGSGEKDSHLALPRIDKPESAMWEWDLLPFRALAQSLPMIMVAHASYPALEDAPPTAPPLPASLSPRLIRELLQRRIGFSGLVLSDDLEMGALEGRSIEQAAIDALRAGCDLLLVCRKAQNVRRVYEALRLQAERDSGFRALLEQAAEKVFHLRRTLPARPVATKPFSDWGTLRGQIQELSAAVRARCSISEPRP